MCFFNSSVFIYYLPYLILFGILLGTMGEIKINNRSRLSEGQAERFLSGLKAGSIIKNGPLETVLNNLNDLPGIAAAGILSAGTEVGSSDLTVTLADKNISRTSQKAITKGRDALGYYSISPNIRYNLSVNNGRKALADDHPLI